MTAKLPFRDRLYHLAQVGERFGVQLVRITALDEANRYTARPIEFDEDGATKFATEETVTVTNLAEPADTTGAVPYNTDAVAFDVEGRWVVYLRPSETLLFAAKIIGSLSGAAYTVREQVPTGPGTFADQSGASNITAYNLSELSLGPGAAVPNGTIVLVTMLFNNGNPPIGRYFFDHPAYAKYLS